MYKKSLLIPCLILLTTYCLHGSSATQHWLSSSSLQNKYTQYAASIGVIATISYLCYQYNKKNLTIQNAATDKDPSLTKLNFGDNFLWGVSTSSVQCEESNELHSWSQLNLDTLKKSNPNIQTMELYGPGKACQSFKYWKDDIDKVIHLGCNSYRISIDWSKVQPAQGQWNQDIIAHYQQIAQYCTDNGIELLCCLHHYADPIWFLEQDGFAKDENINLFIEFCQTMYQALRTNVSQWIIISQPVAYALKSYKVSMMPPFEQNSAKADTVMINLFKAHVYAYDMMHEMYKKDEIGKKPFVGLCHQIVQMQAFNPYLPLDQLAATFADRLYNQTLLRFFSKESSGQFQSLMPINQTYQINNVDKKEIYKKFDFFALSYYCPKAFSGITPCIPKAKDTHISKYNTHIIDENGIYNAIVQAAGLGKPVYIVENGIDPIDENQRKLLLQTNLIQISQAITDGYPVLGYMHWTLMDNYEWGKASGSVLMGLFTNRVNHTTGNIKDQFDNHDSLFKESGQYYKDIIATQKMRIS